MTFPGSSTKSDENRIKGTIAHEITHQWFGDLVSPVLWKYIWLNESFATFFANKIVDHYYPENEVWDNPSPRISMSWNADAYHETVPIEIAEQKRTSYNIKSTPIIYGKGGAILRMLENYVGEDEFQKGLQLFLRKHQYDVATSDDLWTALEESSNKPIIKVMKSWILQPGYPIVSVTRKGSTKLVFSQKRFTFLENTDSTLWIIPISLVVFKPNGEQIELSYLLDKKDSEFDIGFEFKAFKLNYNKVGFYRVSYESSDLQMLESYVKANKFSSLDCQNLVDDRIALFKSGNLTLDEYLAFIANFTSQKLYSALASISNFFTDLQMLVEESTKEKVISTGIAFHEKFLDKIGYEQKSDEYFKISTLRNTLLINAGYLGSPKAIQFGLSEFQKLKNGSSLPPDSLEAVLSIAARETDELSWFIEQFTSAKNEADICMYGDVFGDFKDEKSVNYVLDEIIFNKIPLRNQATIINRLCNNPYAIDKMWKWFNANLDNFGKMTPSIQGRSINFIISNSLTEKADMEKFFNEFGKKNRIAKITSEKAFESLDINLQIKGYLA